jgi:hypothetical protein
MSEPVPFMRAEETSGTTDVGKIILAAAEL